MDKKYLYYGGACVGAIVVYVLYKKRQAAAYAQARANQQAQSDAAMSGYLSAPISGQTPQVVYSSPAGVGAMSVGTPEQSQSNNDNLYALASAQSAQTMQAQLEAQRMTNDLMVKLTTMQNQSQYDLQRQSNQNSGVFSYALSAMPFGGSVNVDTTSTGTSLFIDNKTWDNQQFINQTNATHLANIDSIAKTEADAKLAAASAIPAPDIVSNLYASIGRQNPDAEGVAYWRTQLASGKSLDQVATGFYDAVISRPANQTEADRAALIKSTL